MGKLITKNLCMYMVIAMVISAVAIFMLQTNTAKRDNTNASYEKLETVKAKLMNNDEEVRQLTEMSSENALAKARSISYMVELNPSILDSTAEMIRLAKLLDVDEIHISDENGILLWGNMEGYYGFDFASGDQSAAFLPILTDSTFELAQEPQPNSIQGTLIQYIGISRYDKPGIVQIGLRPEVLENTLKLAAIDKALEEFEFGNTGSVFAINRADNTIAYCIESGYIGESMETAGFPSTIMSGESGKMDFKNETTYYVSDVYGDYVIGTMMPSDEYYSMRNQSTILVCLTMFVIFVVLLLLINNLIKRKVVKGINEFANDLGIIAGGNLDLVVSVTGNKEFVLLSNGINSMVNSIKENLHNNQELVEKQKEDMEGTKDLILNIRKACKNIDQVSSETLSISQSIQSGTSEQEMVVKQLNDTMDMLSSQLKISAENSSRVSKDSAEMASDMVIAKENMNLLTESMEYISQTSTEIEKIIGEIDSIASQTNMLSLNASIEAARAGESGRGFAVVASQVGELASRSTEAAQETNKLIEASLKAVTKGQETAKLAVDEFMKVAEKIESTGKEIGQLAGMVNEQVVVVNDAVDKLDMIAKVTEQNSSVSVASETSSEYLAEEARKLRELTNK